MLEPTNTPQLNRYARIMERIFLSRYRDGMQKVDFSREDIVKVARELDIALPKNLGDVIYSFRYRTALPASITSKAPEGKAWIIRPGGTALYNFFAAPIWNLTPSALLAEIKVPDSTPGIIAMYALSDEQALLAKLRYNRLIDTFLGITCYSLQNHLRTSVVGMGQVETDEVYVGVDRRGVHYVLPVQAKGGSDKHNIVQIEQDFALCAAKFPQLICRAIGAQFMEDNLIALFEFESGDDGVRLRGEKHYRLVTPKDLTSADLLNYQQRPVD